MKKTAALLCTLAAALVACSPGMPPTGPAPDSLIVVAGAGQSTTVATALAIDPLVQLRDGRGSPRRNVMVRFTVDASAGFVTVDSVATDTAGRATTRWYLGASPGQHTLQVRASDRTASLAATATALVPGTKHFGRNQYIEFRVGNLPVVVTAPHGGQLLPIEIPDRTVGETVRDSNTDLLAAALDSAFTRARGHQPHTIIVHLHRQKLDANREIVEAAQGNAQAAIAWREFHGFIQAAREDVRTRFGNGLVVDLHGHGHAIPRLELGYLLSGAELARSDAELNTLAAQTSVRSLVQRKQVQLSALLRGVESLGTLFEQQGFAAVPSSTNPHPAGAQYFSGGFITEQHGSVSGGSIDAVQIEAHLAGVRDSQANRRRFAEAIAAVLDRYFTLFYTTLPR